MLDKKSLGTSGGSLIHVAWNEHGPPAARAFIGVWQRVVNYWIVNRGYSIGIGDTIADAKTMDDIVATIDASPLIASRTRAFFGCERSISQAPSRHATAAPRDDRATARTSPKLRTRQQGSLFLYKATSRPTLTKT